MEIEDKDYGKMEVPIKFDFKADRAGFRFHPKIQDSVLYRRVVTALENKDAFPVAKKMLNELGASSPCLEDLNVYVNFDKLLSNSKGAKS